MPQSVSWYKIVTRISIDQYIVRNNTWLGQPILYKSLISSPLSPKTPTQAGHWLCSYRASFPWSHFSLFSCVWWCGRLQTQTWCYRLLNDQEQRHFGFQNNAGKVVFDSICNDIRNDYGGNIRQINRPEFFWWSGFLSMGFFGKTYIVDTTNFHQ